MVNAVEQFDARHIEAFGRTIKKATPPNFAACIRTPHARNTDILRPVACWIAKPGSVVEVDGPAPRLAPAAAGWVCGFRGPYFLVPLAMSAHRCYVAPGRPPLRPTHAPGNGNGGRSRSPSRSHLGTGLDANAGSLSNVHRRYEPSGLRRDSRPSTRSQRTKLASTLAK